MTRLICVCIFFWSVCVSSQEEAKAIDIRNKPLSKVISLIENKYKLKFSYINSLIDNKKVSITLTPGLSPKKIIKKLQKQTQLNFKITGANYITIRSFNKKDRIEICGYLVNKEKKPIKNSSLLSVADSSVVHVNNVGFFKIKQTLYDSEIIINAPGFVQKKLNTKILFKEECPLIFLTNVPEEVLEVVHIQEHLAKGITQNGNAIHIDLDKVEALPGQTEPDILHTLQLTPGVNNPFETASGLFVRGGSPNQNLVLWNGIKTYQQGHLFGMISAFNPYVAKDVDFFKKGVSAKYGDRVSGVIDIKSENQITNKFTGGSGFNMIHADAVAHIPIINDKASLQISGRRSYTDVLETFTYKQFSDRVFQNTKITETASFDDKSNNFFYADYNANLILKPSKNNTIEVNTIYNRNDLNFKTDQDIESFNDNLITKNEGYNFNWNHNYTQNLSQKISAYYTKYNLNYQFITRNLDEIVEIETKKNRVRDFGGAYDIDYKISNHQKIAMGYQFSKNRIKYKFNTTTTNYELTLDEDNRSLNTHSAYTEYILQKPGSYHLSTGLRLNYYSELKETYIEPRIFAEKNITKNWKINSSIEYRSQATSQIRESVISELSLENHIWTLANDNQFPIINSYQYTFGTIFKANKWYFDIDTYYKQIDNITSRTAGFLNPTDDTYHTGKSRILGVDLFIKKKFKNYKTWVSYSYINTRNLFDGINNNRPFPGNWNIEHTIKWSHFYKINNFHFSLGWMWHSGKAFTNISGIDDSDNIIMLEYDNINSNNLPKYHRLDFSTIYNFKLNSDSTTKYRIGLSLLNVYDKKNILNKEFRTTNSLMKRLINTKIYSLGITPNISFRVFW